MNLCRLVNAHSCIQYLFELVLTCKVIAKENLFLKVRTSHRSVSMSTPRKASTPRTIGTPSRIPRPSRMTTPVKGTPRRAALTPTRNLTPREMPVEVNNFVENNQGEEGITGKEDMCCD